MRSTQHIYFDEGELELRETRRCVENSSVLWKPLKNIRKRDMLANCFKTSLLINIGHVWYIGQPIAPQELYRV